jgi:hypothetical protein
MPAFKIITLQRDKLVLEPIPSEAGLSHFHSHSDLSREASELKQTLRDAFLIEDVDYKMIDSTQHGHANKTRFEFSTPTLVIRALNMIPIALFQKQEDYHNPYKSSDSVQKTVQSSISKFAGKITEKECCVYDKKFCDLAYKTLFEALKLSIDNVHKEYATPSTVIDQLNRDITYISSLNNDDTFGLNRYTYLNAALYFALKTEQAAPSIKDKGIVFKESSLAPKYASIIDGYGTAYGRRTHPDLTQSMTFYSQHIKPHTAVNVSGSSTLRRA